MEYHLLNLAVDMLSTDSSWLLVAGLVGTETTTIQFHAHGFRDGRLKWIWTWVLCHIRHNRPEWFPPESVWDAASLQCLERRSFARITWPWWRWWWLDCATRWWPCWPWPHSCRYGWSPSWWCFSSRTCCWWCRDCGARSIPTSQGQTIQASCQANESAPESQVAVSPCPSQIWGACDLCVHAVRFGWVSEGGIQRGPQGGHFRICRFSGQDQAAGIPVHQGQAASLWMGSRTPPPKRHDQVHQEATDSWPWFLSSILGPAFVRYSSFWWCLRSDNPALHSHLQSPTPKKTGITETDIDITWTYLRQTMTYLYEKTLIFWNCSFWIWEGGEYNLILTHLEFYTRMRGSLAFGKQGIKFELHHLQQNQLASNRPLGKKQVFMSAGGGGGSAGSWDLERYQSWWLSPSYSTINSKSANTFPHNTSKPRPQTMWMQRCRIKLCVRVFHLLAFHPQGAQRYVSLLLLRILQDAISFESAEVACASWSWTSAFRLLMVSDSMIVNQWVRWGSLEEDMCATSNPPIHV